MTVHGFQVLPRPFGVVTRNLQAAQLFPMHMSLTKNTNDYEEEEEVNIVDDVNTLTVMTIGLAAIAINFIIFANMGDARLGDSIFRIINAIT